MERILITKANEENIINKFKEVIAYSQNLDLHEIQTDRTFNAWADNKLRFYKAFGEKLIYDCGKVDCSLSPAGQTELFRKFRRWASNALYSSEEVEAFRTFLEVDLNPEDFFNNSFSQNVKAALADGEVKVFPSGMKVLKSFKFFFKDEETIRKVQDKASEYIQQVRLTGTLCLSIHPLDFLSSSCNASNWRSCHALDGEYRAGNLSYMMDTDTIMAYIRSDKEKTIPGFPFEWNDKKWRNLIYINQDNTMIFAGRPYPLESIPAIEKVGTVLADLRLTPQSWWGPRECGWKRNRLTNVVVENYNDAQVLESHPYNPENGINSFGYYSDERYGLYNGYILGIDHFIQNDSSFCHYNDLIHSSTYYPLHMIADGMDPRSEESFKKSFAIGHEVYCMYDENHIITHDDANYLVCEDCGGYEDEDRYIWCDICGERMERDYDSYYYLDHEDMYICPHCAESNTTECHHCGGYGLNRNMTIGADGNAYCYYCQEYAPIAEENEEEEEENGSSECEHRSEEELHHENN